MDIMALVKAKKQAIQAASGRRENTVKVQPGKHKFRILPGWDKDDPTFFQDFSQHFIKNTRDEIQAVYLCVEKTYGKTCPVCDAIAQGISECGDDETINALKEGQSRGRVLVNALELSGGDPSTPIVLDLSPTTFQKVLELMDEYGNITDLNEGTDLVISRTGAGINTEYSVLPAAKSKPIDDSVMKNINNLSDYVKQEYDEGRNKAIAAVSTVSGVALIPLAGAGADVPLLTETIEDDEEFATAVEPVEATALEGDAAVDAVATDDEMSDDELEDMLATL